MISVDKLVSFAGYFGYALLSIAMLAVIGLVVALAKKQIKVDTSVRKPHHAFPVPVNFVLACGLIVSVAINAVTLLGTLDRQIAGNHRENDPLQTRVPMQTPAPMRTLTAMPATLQTPQPTPIIIEKIVYVTPEPREYVIGVVNEYVRMTDIPSRRANAEVLTSFNASTPVQVIGLAKGDNEFWFRVRAKGHIGYLRCKFINLAENELQFESYEATPLKAETIRGVTMFRAPSFSTSSSNFVKTLKSRAEVYVVGVQYIENDDDDHRFWYRIISGDDVGYINGIHAYIANEENEFPFAYYFEYVPPDQDD